MKRYKYYQPNKKDIKCESGDCVVRAICKVTGKSWLEVFDELVVYARELQSLPNSPATYKKYLENNGFQWVGLKAVKGKARPTPSDIHRLIPKGTYILRLANHVVAYVDGCYYDTWDSGDCSVYGYYQKV